MIKMLKEEDVVAVVLKRNLRAAGGKDSVVFPPTYANKKKNLKDPEYDINVIRGKKDATIDSFGSQANRLEPIFLHEPYSSLVPQVVVRAGDERRNLLEIGHRSADAFARCSSLQDYITKAFQAIKSGDQIPMAKLNPTLFVFGGWDSRGTHVKVKAILRSSIRATDVDDLGRKAQYFAAVGGDKLGIKSPDTKLSESGFSDAPATNLKGGVIVHGDIIQETILNMVALRKLNKRVQDYVLGLALTCMTHPSDYDLRQGCLLVQTGESFVLVKRDGSEVPVSMISHDEALEFATRAAKDFGVGGSVDAEFDDKLAKKEIKNTKKDKDDKDDADAEADNDDDD